MTSGGCEILHADCIEVLQTLAENSFDALITDPPYSSGGQYRGDRMQSVTEKYSQSGAKAEYLKHAFEGDNMDHRPVRGKRHHDMRSISGRLRRAGYRAEQVSRRKGAGKINKNHAGGGTDLWAGV